MRATTQAYLELLRQAGRLFPDMPAEAKIRQGTQPVSVYFYCFANATGPNALFRLAVHVHGKLLILKERVDLPMNQEDSILEKLLDEAIGEMLFLGLHRNVQLQAAHQLEYPMLFKTNHFPEKKENQLL